MGKIDEIRKEVSKLELNGKSVKYLLDNHGYLYYRIYNYSKRMNIWLPKLFFELGLVNGHVDGLDSLEKLDIFMEIFSYRNNDWSLVKPSHKVLVKKVLESLNVRLDIFLSRYNMTNIDWAVYHSIEEVKQDLASKGLTNSSIVNIQTYDQGATIANIESFASRENLKLKDIWFALGIPYDKSLVVSDTGVKKDFVYHNDDEIMIDLKSKDLIGKTKRAVWLYDNGKTVARIQRYANRCDVDVQFIWDKFEIADTPKTQIELSFSNLDQLKIIIEQKGLAGKTITDVNMIDPDLCLQIKKWARNGTPMKSIWKHVGVLRGHGFNDSLDEIVSEIQKAGYKTAREVRGNWNFYKKISSFAKRKNLTTKEIWEKAGISFSQEGRPSKAK